MALTTIFLLQTIPSKPFSLSSNDKASTLLILLHSLVSGKNYKTWSPINLIIEEGVLFGPSVSQIDLTNALDIKVHKLIKVLTLVSQIM